MMSVGGADHRITTFGSAVSVVEFPCTASSFVGCFKNFPSGEVSQFADSSPALKALHEDR